MSGSITPGRNNLQWKSSRDQHPDPEQTRQKIAFSFTQRRTNQKAFMRTYWAEYFTKCKRKCRNKVQIYWKKNSVIFCHSYWHSILELNILSSHPLNKNKAKYLCFIVSYSCHQFSCFSTMELDLFLLLRSHISDGVSKDEINILVKCKQRTNRWIHGSSIHHTEMK